jgi:hypothetical protein
MACRNGGREDAADVRAPLGPRQAGLPCARAGASEELDHLERPAAPELAGQLLGRVVAAPELPRTVGRDVRDDVDRRPLDVGDDELSGKCGGAAEGVLLPRVHERSGRPGIGDRRARRDEREPAARTLAAPLDRPGGRCSAAHAARADQQAQVGATALAHRLGGRAAGDAAARQEEVGEPRHTRYGRSRNVSVPTL